MHPQQFLSAQYSIINNRHNGVQQISWNYSSCKTEMLYNITITITKH